MFHVNTDTLKYPSEIVRSSIVIEELEAMMKRKRSMKMHLGSRFEVCRALQYDDHGEPKIGPTSRIVREVDEKGDEEELEVKESKPYSQKTVTVQPHNLIDTLNDQAGKLDTSVMTIPHTEGSEWHLYRLLTIFIKDLPSNQ